MIVVDLVVILLLGLVLLILLATMRDVAILQERISVYRQLLLRPLKPTYTGDVMPEPLAETVHQTVPDFPAQDKHIVIGFWRPDCTGCRDYVSELAKNRDKLRDVLLISIVGRGSGSNRFLQAVQSVGPAILDSKEVLFDSGQIRTTPSFLSIRAGSTNVSEYQEGGDLQWLISLSGVAST